MSVAYLKEPKRGRGGGGRGGGGVAAAAAGWRRDAGDDGGARRLAHAMEVELRGVREMSELRDGFLQAYREHLGVALEAHALRVHARRPPAHLSSSPSRWR